MDYNQGGTSDSCKSDASSGIGGCGMIVSDPRIRRLKEGVRRQRYTSESDVPDAPEDINSFQELMAMKARPSNVESQRVN